MSLGFGADDTRNRCLTIVETATSLGASLVKKADSDLRLSSRALAARCSSGPGPDEDALIAEASALYVESTRRAGGTPHSREQLFAAAAMCLGVAAELPRGTNRSAGLAAYWHSMRGQG